jgi:hypothetical protein
MMPKALSILAIAVLLGPTASLSAQQAQGDVRTQLVGRWRWEHSSADCKDGHVISFSADGRLMLLTPAPPKGDTTDVTQYEILGLGPSTVRGRIIDETRRTDRGEVVVWDLVLLERDRYCWHRTDWQSGGCTQPIVRCKARPASRPTTTPAPGRDE